MSCSLAGALHLKVEHVGQQEGQLDRLRRIKARVAVRVITIGQRRIGDGNGAAGAFRDVLAGHLDMNAAGVDAFRPAHLEEGLDLLANMPEEDRGGE